MLLIINLFIFLLEIVFRRSFVGAGTLVNAFFLGYITTFFYSLWTYFFALPGSLLIQIPIMLVGTIVTGFARGIVGLGTLVSALGLGHVIDFFNVHFTRKLFGQDENIL